MAISSLVQNVSYAQIAAPLVVAAGAVAVLVAEVFLPSRRKQLVSWLALAVLAGAAAPDIALWPGRSRGTFCMPQSAAGLYSLGVGEPHTMPSTCSYVADRFALIFQFVALAGAFIVVLMSASSMKRDRIPTGEYHFLLLSSVAGVLVLAASRDLITLTVALETVSLPAFALVGLKRWSGKSSEAALKFFLVSVASTAVMLFGISLVYGVTGNVHFGPVALHLNALTTASGGTSGPMRHLAYLGVGLTLVGFGFKVSAVPFHFWTPDTYAGAPVPIAAYLSVVSKAAGFAGLILLTGQAFSPLLDKTGPLLAVLAALTMTLGNLVALRQTDAVRLLAWSTIGQAGYILVPLAAHDQGSYAKHVDASVAYIIMYAAMNLGAFAVVHSVVHSVVGAPGGRSAVAVGSVAAVESGVAVESLVAVESAPAVRATKLDAYRGLAKTRPLASAALAFFLLCLAGLPPGLMGLFAKVAVFGAAAGSHLVWLAVVMAVNVVIALYYYLSWTARLFAAPDAVAVAAGGAAAGAVAVAAGDAAADAVAAADAAGGVVGSVVVRSPVTLRFAIGLALVAAVVFSVWPQTALGAF